MSILVPPAVPAGHMAARDQPIIETDNGLFLRPWTSGDAPVLIEAGADPAIVHWHFWKADDTAEAEAWIETKNAQWRREESGNWAVADAPSGPPIGRVALTSVDLSAGRAELSYWVLPRARGRGVATGAVRGLADWAFADLGLHRLDIGHSVHNQPSCAVANRAGFRFEGTRRSALRHADGWHDMHLHARITGDP